MRIFIAILCCLIQCNINAQAGFFCTIGGSAESSLEHIVSFEPKFQTLRLYGGVGVEYKINEAMSVDQILSFHVNDSQVPKTTGVDQKPIGQYLTMQLSYNYMVNPYFEPLIGFKFGSIFSSNDITGNRNTFFQTRGYDMSIFTGFKSKLSKKIEVHLKHDLFYFRNQSYLNLLSSVVPSFKKNKVLWLGISYAPFVK